MPHPHARPLAVVADELGRMGWTPENLRAGRKHDPDKLRIALRLRPAFAAPERLGLAL